MFKNLITSEEHKEFSDISIHMNYYSYHVWILLNEIQHDGRIRWFLLRDNCKSLEEAEGIVTNFWNPDKVVNFAIYHKGDRII